MISAWIQASRPKTLPAAIVPVWLGVVLAHKLGCGVDWLVAFATMFGAIFIQIATNFFNDVIDAKKGADTSARLGPARMTADKRLSARTVTIAGVICLLLALVCGIPIYQAGGWPMLVIGALSFFFSYGYTGGPFPLAYLGLGELFVVLFFGFVAVSGTTYLQMGEWRPEALLLGFQVGLLSAVLISINNLRDHLEDRQSNKNTLAVRLGVKGGRLIITLECLIAALLGVVWYQYQLPIYSYASFVPLLLGGIICFLIHKTEPSRVYNKFLAFGAMQLVVFAIVFTVFSL